MSNTANASTSVDYDDCHGFKLLEKFTEVLRKQQQERADKERDRIRLLAADPFDPDAQTRIAEEIRQVPFTFFYKAFTNHIH